MVKNLHRGTDFRSLERRYASLDLLRVICMFMIVLSHGIGPQEFISSEGINVSRLIMAMTATFSGVAVNCLVLISGFFLIYQKFRLSRLIRLAMEVLFYSWAILLVYIFCGKELGIKELLALIFPISYEHYWFISAYFGLSLISPVLNTALNAINRKQHFSSIVVLILCFSLWSDLLPKANPVSADSGYSFIWFVVLYVIASYIRKYVDIEQVKKKVSKNLAVYVLVMFVVFALNSVMTAISLRYPILITYEINTFFSRYNCILVMIGSLTFFLCFLGMELSRGEKLLHSISKLTLGVYLLHGGPFTSSYAWRAVSGVFNIKMGYLYPVTTIAKCLFLFVVCIVIDFVRSRIFRIWENSEWFIRWMKRIDQAVYKIGNSICKYVD